MSGTKREGKRSRGYFGIAIHNPKHEVNVGSLLRTAFLYDAAFLATVGRRYEKQASDTPGVANHIPLHHYGDVEDFLGHLPRGCPLVAIELSDNAIPLPEFTHPPRACYLLGAEDHGIPPRILDRCHYVVQVPGEKDWSMNVANAGSIVMYDRFAKLSKTRLAVAS